MRRCGVGDKMASMSHFGINIRPGKLGPKLTRENYAIIDKRSSTNEYVKACLDAVRSQNEKEKFLSIYKGVFEDESATTYTDTWCQEQRRKALINFDLNMKLFASLDHDEFNEEIDRFLRKHRSEFKEITDLNLAEGKSGYYIMVLDEYCQAYIGTSTNIKRRIMTHWSKRKQFDRLIFGSVERSKLSIDSFRALDTTRILAAFSDEVYSVEDDYINELSSKFCANRTGGGIPEFGPLSIAAKAKYRDLK